MLHFFLHNFVLARIRFCRTPYSREPVPSSSGPRVGSVQEVTIIRKMVPVKLTVYYPKTEEGKKELARRVSDVHAAAVTQRLKLLNCPTQQKLSLLESVIITIAQQCREQE